MSALLPVIVILLIIALEVFEVWMFIHAIMNERLAPVNRALWAVGMVVIHPFVAIVYYFVEYQKAA